MSVAFVAPTSGPVLQVSGASRLYAGFAALSDVSFDVHPGECLAIVGENGAGKSTLLKLVTGAETPSAGTIAVGGPLTPLTSTRQARQHGVAFIPQELAYLPDDTVANNVSIGIWPASVGFVRKRQARRCAEDVLARLGTSVDVNSPMRSLALGQRQLVEIGKALVLPSVSLLCLDEPTAALNAEETKHLLAILVGLKEQGVALIYVSHRLDELRVIADRVMVLRNGRNVAIVEPHDASPSRLASLMLGRQASTTRESLLQGRGWQACGGADLVVSGLQCQAEPKLYGVSFTARRGEIVGVYGLAGSGLESIARCLAGSLPRRQRSGRMELYGQWRPLFKTPVDARKAGVMLLPSDRAGEGLALNRPLRENLSLTHLSDVSRFGFVQKKKERRLNMATIETYRLASRSDKDEVQRLSGGTQQKILVANRLATRPRVLILHEPTRGVDVGSRMEIHRMVREAGTDAVVLVATTDIEEVVDVSDRVIVLREGQIANELSGDELTEANVLKWAGEKEGSAADA